MNGTVKSVKLEQGFGFVRPANSHTDAFFHCRDLVDGLEFDERLLERTVEFDLEQSDKGPRARRVRAAHHGV